LLFIPQVFIGLTGTFFIIRVIPGNPVYLYLGTAATKELVDAAEHQFGLDKPLYAQYVDYLTRLFHGDLGISWRSGQAVTADLAVRFPVTFELITLSLVLAICVAVPIGVLLATRPVGILQRLVQGYGLLAGALPEFALGLLLIFVLFAKLKWVPPPIGRLDPFLTPPPRIIGMYTVDGLLVGDWPVVKSAIRLLVLPVATLTFVIIPPILKMTLASMQEVLRSDYIRCARACGKPSRQITGYALRNALPPIITLIGSLYGYLLGGAVLVETIFSLGGMGQYVVEAAMASDYGALQGFVLAGGVFSLAAYLFVDILHALSDPRVRY
jgi:peptide/nickel transport system permease protein